MVATRPGPDRKAIAFADELRTLHGEDPIELRRRVLAALDTLVGGDITCFYTKRLIGSTVRVTNSLTHGPDRALVDALEAHPNPLGQSVSSSLVPPEPFETRAFNEDALLCSREALERSGFFQTFFAPLRVHHQQRLLVVHGGRFIGWVGLARKVGTEPFTARDRRRLQPLVAPVSAALVAADRLEQDLLRGRGPGDLVLRPDGHVEYASREGRAWAASERFMRALRSAVLAFDRGEVLPRPTVLDDAELRLTRLEGNGQVRYLALVAPASPLALATSSLTRRQREVAEAAAAGATLAEIARSYALSIDTVKTHLRVVYQLLEVSNRLELARALADTPAAEAPRAPIPHALDLGRAHVD